MFKTLLFVSLIALFPQLVEARTVTVAGLVTRSTGLVTNPDGSVVTDYPVIGSLGSLSYTLAENDLGAVDPTTSFLLAAPFDASPVTATVSTGPFSAGIIPTAPNGETFMETVFSGPGLVSFGTRTIGQGIVGETFAGSLRFTFSPALASAPVTWNDLFSAIDTGSALASLSWNGTKDGRFIEFEITQTDPAPIPLPASAVLMLTGFGGLAALRRRTSRSRRPASRPVSP